MTTFIIATPSLHKNDAVGNDVMIQAEILNAQPNCKAVIFAEFVDSDLKNLVIKENVFRVLIEESNTVVIYHHSVYWQKINPLLDSVTCPVIMCYHNITPSVFYEDYDYGAFIATKLGRLQTERIVGSKKIMSYIADSKYNANELIQFGAPKDKVSVVGPFNKIDDFIAESSIQRGPNSEILFVGRVVPNKGHKNLILTLERYIQLFGNNIKLSIVGSLSPNLARYYQELETLIHSKGLDDYIQFYNTLSFAELVERYTKSGIFLCLSEHEGFCVPLLEAQKSSLPVVALLACAVKDTLGENQIGFENFDATLFAVAAHRVLHDQELRAQLIAEGLTNVERYGLKQLKEKFLRHIFSIHKI